MRRLALTIALLTALATPSQADLPAGIAAYASGDYATALRELEPLAEQGVAGAQGMLGLIYLEGQGVLRNYAEAAKWFRKAAEQGVAGAQTELGVIYDEGLGIP